MDLDLEDLPPLAQDIVHAFHGDMAAAWEVVESWGGTRLAIPSPKTIRADGEDHTLALKVGLDRAIMLAVYFDGEAIDVPRCARALEILRDKEIISEYGKPGVTADTLARKHKCVRRTIYRRVERHLKSKKKDDRQGVLCFDHNQNA
ncbi:MAG: hypothetical protein HQL72_09185 [Magnetococcales bacterium]|nr:hypothetical protein [Magnetococcales bacterium]